MATLVKIDIKKDFVITLDDFNANSHLGIFEVPEWAKDLYSGKTDEELFDDWTAAIYESFSPIIGEALAWLSIANIPYFNSDRIKGNIRKAIYQEVLNWMMNVPIEVKNNVNFSAQAGFSFSLSIQPWLINYDEFAIKTRAYIQDTGLVGVCVDDLEGIELWIKPRYKNDIDINEVEFIKKVGEDDTTLQVPSVEYLNNAIASFITAGDKAIAGSVKVPSLLDATSMISTYNSGGTITLESGSVYDKAHSTSGDLIYFVPTDSTVDFITEEALVIDDKSMVLMTANNDNLKKLNDLDTASKLHFSQIVNLEKENVDNNLQKDNLKDVTSTGIINSATETPKIANREDVRQYGQAIKTDIEGPLATKNITELEKDSSDLAARLLLLETAETLTDKVWKGDNAFDTAGHSNLGTLVAEDGNTYQFTPGKTFELFIKSKTGTFGVGHNIDVDDTTAVSFVIPSATGSDTLNVKLNNVGAVTGTVLSGTTSISEFEVFKLVEPKASNAVSVGYTKAESDAKYAIVTDLTSKQNALDNTLTTAAKVIPRAIDENKASIDALKLLDDIDTTALTALETKLGV